MARDKEAVLSALLELNGSLKSRQTPEKLGSKTKDTEPILWHLVYNLSRYSLKTHFPDTRHHNRPSKTKGNTTIWKETLSKELKHTWVDFRHSEEGETSVGRRTFARSFKLMVGCGGTDMIRKKSQWHKEERGLGVSCHMGLSSTSQTDSGCRGAVGDHQNKRSILGG